MAAPEIAAIVTALTGCVTDMRFRRIPNELTLGAAAGALGFHLAASGGEAMLWSLAGWALAGCIFVPFFWLGGMGGGDVKLFAALGAWVGPEYVVSIALWASLAGGVMAIVVALASGYLLKAFINLRTLAVYWFYAGLKPYPALTIDSASAGTPRLPFALPIAAGLGMMLWLR